MPECHKCRWNDAPPSDAKAAACHSCLLPEDYVNHKGKVFVSFDSGPSVQTAAEVQAAIEAEQNARAPDVAIDETDPVVRAAMELGALRTIQYFMDLDPSELTLVMMTLCQPLAETARQIGKTRQAVSARFRKVVERQPGLGAILGRGGPRASNAPHPSRTRTPARTDGAQGDMLFDFGAAGEA